MKKCQLCNKCKELLVQWNIPHIVVYDSPELDRLYPYLEFECEYRDFLHLIAKGYFGRRKK